MDEVEDSPKRPFSSVKDDPEHLITLINKYVKVKIIKNTSFDGFLHSIDPITTSAIIINPGENNMYQTVVIPGHAILDISEIPTPFNVTTPLRKETKHIDEREEVLARKSKLISWFKSNLLPVTEEGENIVVGAVKVLPPYNITDIYAENPVVAMQVRNLIERVSAGS